METKLQSEDDIVWHRDIAIQLINTIEEGLRIYNYYPALAGSILLKGYSKNDLDIVLYAEHCHEDYRPALKYIIGKLALEDFRAVEFSNDEKQSDHKLVFESYFYYEGKGRKINFFIPAFSVGGKLDDYTVITKEAGRS